MKSIGLITLGVLLVGLIVGGCENSSQPLQPIQPQESLDKELESLEQSACPPANAPAPSPLVSVGIGAATLELWPYTGVNFSGAPQDPINVIFFGKADPRDIRTALLSLDGDRTAVGMPDAPPFNQTWQDAIGDVQSGYGGPDGWTGSVIQLSCGDYSEPRFHIRLFQVGDWTVANVHFEILIPGTTDHQVLSWELAEQFVVADFMRSGLLDGAVPLVPTSQINDSPFRTIPTFIYNELPVELRALIDGPLGDVTEDVGIPTDGHAMILNVARTVARIPGVFQQNFVLEFGQVIPKPFCSAGPMDYLYVEGPVHMQQTVRLTEGGTFTMSFKAEGDLTVTPVNPITGEPVGEPMEAFAFQRHSSQMNNAQFSAAGVLFQRIGDYGEPSSGALFTRLRINSNGCDGYQAKTRCGVEGWHSLSAPALYKGLLDGGAGR